MHWVGGLGVLVLAVAVLPLPRFGGHSMLKAETPGPMKDAMAAFSTFFLAAGPRGNSHSFIKYRFAVSFE